MSNWDFIFTNTPSGQNRGPALRNSDEDPIPEHYRRGANDVYIPFTFHYPVARLFREDEDPIPTQYGSSSDFLNVPAEEYDNENANDLEGYNTVLDDFEYEANDNPIITPSTCSNEESEPILGETLDEDIVLIRGDISSNSPGFGADIDFDESSFDNDSVLSFNDNFIIPPLEEPQTHSTPVLEQQYANAQRTLDLNNLDSQLQRREHDLVWREQAIATGFVDLQVADAVNDAREAALENAEADLAASISRNAEVEDEMTMITRRVEQLKTNLCTREALCERLCDDLEARENLFALRVRCKEAEFERIETRLGDSEAKLVQKDTNRANMDAAVKAKKMRLDTQFADIMRLQSSLTNSRRVLHAEEATLTERATKLDKKAVSLDGKEEVQMWADIALTKRTSLVNAREKKLARKAERLAGKTDELKKRAKEVESWFEEKRGLLERTPELLMERLSELNGDANTKSGDDGEIDVDGDDA